MTSNFISVDDHVLETRDLWTSRLSAKKWGDSIPHIASNGDGREHWIVDGEIVLDGALSRAGAFMSDRNADPVKWGDIPEEAYVPAKRLAAMDKAGEDFAVLYPTVAGQAGESFGGLADPELELACVQAYNDWLIDEWTAASDRFIPQCIVPISSPEVTAKEIRRAVEKGHRGVIFPALPMDLRKVPHVAEADYDVVWATCAELGVPLCLHTGSSPTLEYERYGKLPPNVAKALRAVTKPVSSVYVLGLYLFSRIFMRHPKLKVVLAESALSWGLLYLEWADHQAAHDGLAKEGYELTPSEMFHRQCYLTVWYDRIAPFAPYLHAGNIMWSSNLPLATSNWPKTQEAIDKCCNGLTEDERRKILWDNASSLYAI